MNSGPRFATALTAAWLLCVASGPVALGGIIYVRSDAAGSNNGASWTNAFIDLQDALEVAEPGDEIWVAGGVYKPDLGTGNRFVSFDLVPGVDIYGGFVGNEVERGQRNPDVHETVLSGDLLGNDDDIPSTSNCCEPGPHAGCEDPACVERVEQVTGGVLRCDLGWREMCAEYAQTYCCNLCRPSRCDNSDVIVRAVGLEPVATIDGFTIRGSEEAGWLDDPTPETPGGQALLSWDGALNVDDCVFVDNAGFAGNSLGSANAVVSVEGCTFRRNTSFAGVWVAHLGGNFSILGCTFEDSFGGGLSIDTPGTIRECRFVRNRGTALWLGSEAYNVVDCVFIGNHDNYSGAAIYNSGITQVINCGFYGNTAGIGGGAIDSVGALVLVNSVFSGNSAGHYAGALKNFGPLTALNNVFVGNFSRSTGGVSSQGGYIANSVFWGNHDLSGFSQHAQIDTSVKPPRPSVRYCDVQGWTGTGLSGIGVVDVDPLFVDADGADDIPGTEDDDFRLSPDSPLIDAGNPEPPFPAFDFDHHARPLCGQVDTGAFEFGFGDYNCDRMLTRQDVTAWSFVCASSPGSTSYRRDACRAFDSDADKDVDLRDFADFTLLFSPASP